MHPLYGPRQAPRHSAASGRPSPELPMPAPAAPACVCGRWHGTQPATDGRCRLTGCIPSITAPGDDPTDRRRTLSHSWPGSEASRGQPQDAREMVEGRAPSLHPHRRRSPPVPRKRRRSGPGRLQCPACPARRREKRSARRGRCSQLGPFLGLPPPRRAYDRRRTADTGPYLQRSTGCCDRPVCWVA